MNGRDYYVERRALLRLVRLAEDSARAHYWPTTKSIQADLTYYLEVFADLRLRIEALGSIPANDADYQAAKEEFEL